MLNISYRKWYNDLVGKFGNANIEWDDILFKKTYEWRHAPRRESDYIVIVSSSSPSECVVGYF